MSTLDTPRYQMQLTVAKLEELGVIVDFKFCRNEQFKVQYISNDDNDYCIGIPKEQLHRLDLNSLANFWQWVDVEYPVRGLTLAAEAFQGKPMVSLKFKIKRS